MNMVFVTAIIQEAEQKALPKLDYENLVQKIQDNKNEITLLKQTLQKQVLLIASLDAKISQLQPAATNKHNSPKLTYFK